MAIVIQPTYHLGHIMMEWMQKHSKLLGQIDGATGQEETFGSMLSRSIRLAKSLRNVGFKPGDVLAVSGWNHLDIHIPYYSGLFNGLPVFGIDPFFKYDEIGELFKITKPKIAFCENDLYDTYVKVAKELKLDTKIITFGEGENSLSNFIHSNDDNEPEEKFKYYIRYLAKILLGNKARMKSGAIVCQCYGQTETIGNPLRNSRDDPPDSCGKHHWFYTYKLVDHSTGKEITEPNVTGELWVKGLCCKEYYNDPEETRRAFTEDGYYKTNDLLYKDENGLYFYVDRLKTIIKWRTCTVLPVELEALIRSHKGVADCCVVGIDDPEDGQRPVACVVRRNESQVTALEIKELVIKRLSQRKELRGGVVFLDEFPMTSSGKIARGKLLQIVSNSIRE